MAHEGHEHGPDCNHDHDDNYEIEVVELEDENGEKEEFAILEELDFESRHFCILAPLSEVQAQAEGTLGEDEGLSLEIFEVKDGDMFVPLDDFEDEGLSLEIFEVKDGDMFVPLDDEALAQRLMTHLDAQAAKLQDEQD